MYVDLDTEGKSTSELWDIIQISDQYKNFKYLVKQRGGYECSHCQTKGNRKNRIHVHHTRPKAWSKNIRYVFSVEHAILLCAKCHILEHKQMRLEDPLYNDYPNASTGRLKKLIKDLTFVKATRRKKRYNNRYRARRVKT